ncbi:hypothetical protein HHK36_008656 [Tetracentron sinense]|uniref:Uncharacterized protein n=1 Tax=Tetracentron sinense TaxID=13715 RepID=A0A834ZJX1_TETSI|nr:hypothetical protein HHK36_008656 [Tetracentron sinense]
MKELERHSRSLLCHVCQSPTPWKASGAKLGPTVSFCEKCVNSSNGRQERGGGDEESEGRNGEDDDDELDEEDYVDEDDDGDAYGENQDVPLSSTPPPPVESSSSSEESSSRFSADEEDQLYLVVEIGQTQSSLCQKTGNGWEKLSEHKDEAKYEEESQEWEGQTRILPSIRSRTSSKQDSKSKSSDRQRGSNVERSDDSNDVATEHLDPQQTRGSVLFSDFNMSLPNMKSMT